MKHLYLLFILLSSCQLLWPATADRAKLVENFGNLPLHFDPNRGQVPSEVRFLARTPGMTVYVNDAEATMVLRAPQTAASGQGEPAPEERSVVRMKLVGAKQPDSIQGVDALPGTSNYFVGTDKSKWQTRVPQYRKVRLADVYPGVDLVYYGNGRQIEYDFVVAPGVDPDTIELEFIGADELTITESGDLRLATSAGPLRLCKPVIYQESEGEHSNIEGTFTLTAKNRVGFRVSAYAVSGTGGVFEFGPGW